MTLFKGKIRKIQVLENKATEKTGDKQALKPCVRGTKGRLGRCTRF